MWRPTHLCSGYHGVVTNHCWLTRRRRRLGFLCRLLGYGSLAPGPLEVSTPVQQPCPLLEFRDQRMKIRSCMATVEPLIKDTLNKGHLCIKDTFPCTNLYSDALLKRGQPLYNDSNEVLILQRRGGQPLYNDSNEVLILQRRGGQPLYNDSNEVLILQRRGGQPLYNDSNEVLILQRRGGQPLYNDSNEVLIPQRRGVYIHI